MLELEVEMAGLQAGVAAAESRAALLESTAATAKDQLLRLTADFDNFRRRTVRAEGGWGGVGWGEDAWGRGGAVVQGGCTLSMQQDIRARRSRCYRVER